MRVKLEAPDRRRMLLGLGSLMVMGVAGCSTVPMPRQQAMPVPPPRPAVPEHVRLMYAAMPEEEFPIPAYDVSELNPVYYRQIVDFVTPEVPGTVVVDTTNRFLYHVQEGGSAMRYGIGVGRAGFDWSGRGHIAYKRKWPVWTPPAEMIARDPSLEQWRHGQPPGITNPLGARALYIHKGNRDTLYRLHGTGEVWTIGKAVSSGCVRLLHQDVIDLYERVRPGSAIVVEQNFPAIV